jgi:hypothetical protein
VHKSGRSNKVQWEAGKFEVKGLLPGRYPLEVQARDYAPWKTEVEIRAGEMTTLNFPEDVPGPSLRIVTDPETMPILVDGKRYIAPQRFVGLQEGQTIKVTAQGSGRFLSTTERVTIDWSEGEEEVEVELEEQPSNGGVGWSHFVWDTRYPYRHVFVLVFPPGGVEGSSIRFSGTGANGADETVSTLRIPMAAYMAQFALSRHLLLDFDLRYQVYLGSLEPSFAEEETPDPGGGLGLGYGAALHFRLARGGWLGRLPLTLRWDQNFGLIEPTLRESVTGSAPDPGS